MALTTFWHADDERSNLLSDMIAISKAGNFRLAPVRDWIVHDKSWLFSAMISGGAP
jgi:hypothetical protein